MRCTIIVFSDKEAKNFKNAIFAQKRHIRSSKLNILQGNCCIYIKFVFSKKATKFDKIFTIDLTLTVKSTVVHFREI